MYHCCRSVVQKEEAELEKLREKERIRSGKELLEAKRKEDDLKLKRNLELRRIEKEEEQRARDRIRVKLGMLYRQPMMVICRAHTTGRLSMAVVCCTQYELAMVSALVCDCADEDRRARRRKLGLPEELTEDEKAQEAATAAKKAEAAKKKNSFVTVKPVSGMLCLTRPVSDVPVICACQANL